MTRRVTAALNGAITSMVSIIITDKTIRGESAVVKSFDLVKWIFERIRVRKLQWFGHILRIDPERKLNQAIFVMFKSRQVGDMLMDVPETSSW